MTRKIEDAMIAAIRNGKSFTNGNTAVRQHGEGHCAVYLHDNLIAEIGHPERGTRWTLAGWNTATTRSRINAMARAFGWRGVSCRGALPYATGSAVAPFEPIVAHQWVNALA